MIILVGVSVQGGAGADDEVQSVERDSKGRAC